MGLKGYVNFKWLMLEEGVVKYVIIRIIIFFEFFEMSVFFVFKIFLYYCIVNVNSFKNKN